MTTQTGLGIKDLLQDKRDEILAIAAKHGAYNVRVFGSVARGEATAESDIDFLIDYDRQRMSSWFPVHLIRDLEALLNRKVDVVSEKSLHYFLKDSILQEAVAL
jgi:predicted nucleotidyltransferase